MLHRLRRGGFDLIAQGMGGITHVSGEPDGPPISVGLPICDLGTGMWAVQGILAPLYERQRTGKGPLVECSLLETVIGFSSWTSAQFLQIAAVDPNLPFGCAKSSASSRGDLSVNSPVSSGRSDRSRHHIGPFARAGSGSILVTEYPALESRGRERQLRCRASSAVRETIS
jgi:hypothetical protein